MSSDVDLGARTVGATKWSLITQVASKLISPLTTIVLARILAPSVIGVISLVTMVTSFADLFSDAGFQKYLIQHEFRSEKDLRLSADVAFWTNFAISVFLWLGVVLFKDRIAVLVGDSTIGPAIAIACGSLPLTAAVSVQTAIYQRALDFKTLFYSRVGSAFLIFIVAVPLALVGGGYWSMIVGPLMSNLFLAVWLTAKSDWRPSFRYSLMELRAMFSFSGWTLLESFSIWLTSWAGTFVLGRVMTGYYLGLYNTSTSLVNSAIGIITSAVNPVIFASLSRLQGNRVLFNSVFYSMQKVISLCVVPIAFALFVFSDLLVEIILGSQWLEASTYFGLYSLASALVIVFCHTASDAYRALGKPRLSLAAQLGFLAIMIPSLYFGASMGFEVFSVVVPLARVVGFVVIHFVICHCVVGLSPAIMIYKLRWVYAATLFIAIPVSIVIKFFNVGAAMQIALALFSVFLYIAELLYIRDLRETLVWLLVKFGLSSFVYRFLPSRLSGLVKKEFGEDGGDVNEGR